MTVSDQANLSSFDHRQGSSNERPKDRGFKSLNDARLLCPSWSTMTRTAQLRAIIRSYARGSAEVMDCWKTLIRPTAGSRHTRHADAQTFSPETFWHSSPARILSPRGWLVLRLVTPSPAKPDSAK
jgi:hypothetical protein